MQVQEVLIFDREFLGRHVDEGAVEVVDAIEEVFGKALQGEVTRGLDFAFRLVLQVAVVGYCAF